MKYYFLLITIFIKVQLSYGQFDTIVSLSNHTNQFIFTKVEKPPLYNGAKNEEESNKMVIEYLESKIKGLNLNKEGGAIIKIGISENNSISEINIRSTDQTVIDEIIKSIKDMSNWKSGEQRGKKVEVRLEFKILFNR